MTSKSCKNYQTPWVFNCTIVELSAMKINKFV